MLYYAHACMTSIHGSIEVIVLVARSKQQYRVSAQRTSSNSNQEDLMSSKLEMNQLLSFYSNIHVWEKPLLPACRPNIVCPTLQRVFRAVYAVLCPTLQSIQSSICTSIPHPIEQEQEQHLHKDQVQALWRADDPKLVHYLVTSHYGNKE